MGNISIHQYRQWFFSLDYDCKITGRKQKIDEQDYIKLRNFCTAKEAKWLDNLQSRGKVQANLTDKGLIPKIHKASHALVTHTCNSSYSEGRNQEGSGSKPTWANSLRDPISKKPITKKGLVEWLKLWVPA
jgi:hypothetical protein